MKRIKLAVTGGLATILLFAGVAFSQPRYGCHQRFNSMDANHDGKLTKAEFVASPHGCADPGKMFDARDTQKRGYLTVEEFCSGAGGRGMCGRGMGAGMGNQGTATKP
jgi:Ca2+-binding EF-hand superfamily protein